MRLEAVAELRKLITGSSKKIPFESRALILVALILLILTTLFYFEILPSMTEEFQDFERAYYIDYSSLRALKQVSVKEELHSEVISLSTEDIPNEFIVYTMVPSSLAEGYSDFESNGIVDISQTKRLIKTRQGGENYLFLELNFKTSTPISSTLNVIFERSFVDRLSEEQWSQLKDRLLALADLELSPDRANALENEIGEKIVDAYATNLAVKNKSPAGDMILLYGTGVSPSLFSSILSALEPSGGFETGLIPGMDRDTSEYTNVKDEWLPMPREEKKAAFPPPEELSLEVDYLDPKGTISFMSVNQNDLSFGNYKDEGFSLVPPFYEAMGKDSENWIPTIPEEDYEVEVTPSYEFNPSFPTVKAEEVEVLDVLSSLPAEERVKGKFEEHLTAEQKEVFDSMVEDKKILENEPYQVNINFDFTPYLQRREKIPEKFEGNLEATNGVWFGGEEQFDVDVKVNQIEADVLLVTIGKQLEKDPNYEAALERYTKALENDGLKASYYELDDPEIGEKLYYDSDFSRFIGDDPNPYIYETKTLKVGEETEFPDGTRISLMNLPANETMSSAHFSIVDKEGYGKEEYLYEGVNNIDGERVYSVQSIDGEKQEVTINLSSRRVPGEEFRQNQLAQTKEAIDTLREHTDPDYLVILGGDKIIPVPKVYITEYDPKENAFGYGKTIFTDDLLGASEFSFDKKTPILKASDEEAVKEAVSDVVIARMPTPSDTRSTELITTQLENATKKHEEGVEIDNAAIYADDDEPDRLATRFFRWLFRKDTSFIEDESQQIAEALTPEEEEAFRWASDYYSYMYPEENKDIKLFNENFSIYDDIAEQDLVIYDLHGDGTTFSGRGPPDKKEVIAGEGEDEQSVPADYAVVSAEEIPEKLPELDGQIALSTCCYGAALEKELSPEDKTVVLNMLESGTAAFVGNSDVGYACSAAEKAGTSELISDILWKMKEDDTVGGAFYRTKRDNMQEEDLSFYDIHNIMNLQLYGDPTLDPEFDEKFYQESTEGQDGEGQDGSAEQGNGVENGGSEGQDSDTGNGGAEPAPTPAE